MLPIKITPNMATEKQKTEEGNEPGFHIPLTNNLNIPIKSTLPMSSLPLGHISQGFYYLPIVSKAGNQVFYMWAFKSQAHNLTALPFNTN